MVARILARDVRVTVNRAEIAALFARRGIVGRWLNRRLLEIRAEATAEAPGSGAMKLQHRHNMARAGANRVRGTVSNLSDHAWFVHEGTARFHRGGMRSARIYPRTARALRTPWGPRRSVEGQRANPWLERAARVVLLRYGIRL